MNSHVGHVPWEKRQGLTNIRWTQDIKNTLGIKINEAASERLILSGGSDDRTYCRLYFFLRLVNILVQNGRPISHCLLHASNNYDQCWDTDLENYRQRWTIPEGHWGIAWDCTEKKGLKWVGRDCMFQWGKKDKKKTGNTLLHVGCSSTKQHYKFILFYIGTSYYLTLLLTNYRCEDSI